MQCGYTVLLLGLPLLLYVVIALGQQILVSLRDLERFSLLFLIYFLLSLYNFSFWHVHCITVIIIFFSVFAFAFALFHWTIIRRIAPAFIFGILLSLPLHSILPSFKSILSLLLQRMLHRLIGRAEFLQEIVLSHWVGVDGLKVTVQIKIQRDAFICIVGVVLDL